MNKTNFTFLSNDGKTAVHAVKWTPDEGSVKAVLQIAHGMVEFIERYTTFAEYLTQKYGDWKADLPEEEKKGHHFYSVMDLEKSYTEYL